MPTNTAPELSRQERIDLWASRTFDRLSPRANRFLFRATRGRIGSRKRGVPIALLTTTGRVSGKARTVPVMYLDDGDRFLLVASNGGFDPPPSWLRNLEANPEAVFEPAGRRIAVRARVLGGAEKQGAWPRLVAHNPLWGAYQALTSRDLRVVALERLGGDETRREGGNP